MSLRIRGSPPVSFTLEMSNPTAILTMRTISSTVISAAKFSVGFSSPSKWQYWQYKLQRRVIATRKLSNGRPQLSLRTIVIPVHA
jgi:hypothetical protein